MAKKIILITGAKGSGKSTALAGLVPANKESWEQTLIFDTEDSWSDLVKEDKGKYYLNLEGKDKIKVGEFIRAYDRFRPTDNLLEQIAQGKLPWVSQQQKNALLGYYDYFVNTLSNKLAAEKFKYVLIDTVEPVEAALTAWAETNKSLSGWSGSRAFGRLETEAVRPLYENLIEAIGRRGVEIVGLSSHLKQPWEGDKPIPNKVEPGGRLKLLSRISTMMVWLVSEPNNYDGCPAALILKARLSKMAIKDGVLTPQRVLPERMPHFTWHDVEEYLKHPVNLAQPQPNELMSDTERAMISEMLNDEQMRLMIASAESRETQSGFAVPVTEAAETEPQRLLREKREREVQQNGS